MPPLPPLNILMVEPHDDMATVLARALNRAGHAVMRAGTLAEARVVCEVAPRIDLVIAEFRLPDGDARSLVAEGGPCHGRPGIVLSIYDDDDDLARSRAAGFAAHLRKTIALDELTATIARVTALPDPGAPGPTG